MTTLPLHCVKIIVGDIGRERMYYDLTVYMNLVMEMEPD